MKQIMLMGVLGLMMLGLTVAPSQADFQQCPECAGTDNADVINGSALPDAIDGGLENDIIFGGGEIDAIAGNDGDDILVGGLGSDNLLGDNGNDTLLPGPDQLNAIQTADGGAGNDTYNVLVSETSYCLMIIDPSGADVVNLLGFGPYSAVVPFGQPGFVGAWIHVVDPIANGDILIQVFEAGDVGVERINGLLSPNVTITDTVPANCVPA